MPRVTEFDGAAYGSLGGPADPDWWMWNLLRTRQDSVSSRLIAGSQEAELVGRPGGLERLQILVRQFVPRFLRHAKRSEFGLHIAGTDAQDKSALREHVQRGS